MSGKQQQQQQQVEVIYQREGVVIMEHSRSDRPVGVVSAFCHINVCIVYMCICLSLCLSGS